MSEVKAVRKRLVRRFWRGIWRSILLSVVSIGLAILTGGLVGVGLAVSKMWLVLAGVSGVLTIVVAVRTAGHITNTCATLWDINDMNRAVGR